MSGDDFVDASAELGVLRIADGSNCLYVFVRRDLSKRTMQQVEHLARAAWPARRIVLAIEHRVLESGIYPIHAPRGTLPQNVDES